MVHFTTYAAMVAASNPKYRLDGSIACHDTRKATDTWQCESCGTIAEFSAANSCGTGYAVTSDNRMTCYSCARARSIEALRDRSRSFVAYISSDGRSITDWSGGMLARVTDSRPCLLTRASHWHDRHSYRSIHAVDPHGGHWHGRGSPGVCITLRPCKG